MAYAPNFLPIGKLNMGLKVNAYCRALAPGVCRSCLVLELMGKSCHINSAFTPNLGVKAYPPPTTIFAPLLTNEPKLLWGKPTPPPTMKRNLLSSCACADATPARTTISAKKRRTRSMITLLREEYTSNLLSKAVKSDRRKLTVRWVL